RREPGDLVVCPFGRSFGDSKARYERLKAPPNSPLKLANVTVRSRTMLFDFARYVRRRPRTIRDLRAACRVYCGQAMKISALALLLLLVGCSRPYDASYDTSVSAPAYVGALPRILVDQGHHNRHTVSGTYKPFAELLRNDGCSVSVSSGRVTGAALDGVQVLVIPAALGTDDQNSSPAFSPSEVDTIVTWIAAGGSLLLITDHF